MGTEAAVTSVRFATCLVEVVQGRTEDHSIAAVEAGSASLEGRLMTKACSREQVVVGLGVEEGLGMVLAGVACRTVG